MTIPVKIVKEHGSALLVEWQDAGRARRAVVQRTDVQGGRADALALDAGIPYGVAWEEVIHIAVTPQAIADELRRRNIWTLADVEARPNETIAALQRVLSLDVAALRRAAEQYEHGG